MGSGLSFSYDTWGGSWGTSWDRSWGFVAGARKTTARKRRWLPPDYRFRGKEPYLVYPDMRPPEEPPVKPRSIPRHEIADKILPPSALLAESIAEPIDLSAIREDIARLGRIKEATTEDLAKISVWQDDEDAITVLLLA